MDLKIGKKIWAIGEGYIPDYGNGPEPEFISHEAVCILNASDEQAGIRIYIYFEDRDQIGPYKFSVEPRRTKHIRFNDFEDPETIPTDTNYSSIIKATVPVIVQHTRLDSRQSENALLSTIAYSE